MLQSARRKNRKAERMSKAIKANKFIGLGNRYSAATQNLLLYCFEETRSHHEVMLEKDLGISQQASCSVWG